MIQPGNRHHHHSKFFRWRPTVLGCVALTLVCAGVDASAITQVRTGHLFVPITGLVLCVTVLSVAWYALSRRT